MTTPETKVKTKLKSWLAKNARWHTPISDRYASGLPDMIVVGIDAMDTRHAFIEVKAPQGHMSPMQYKVCKQIIEAGGTYFVVSLDPKGELQFFDMSTLKGQFRWAPTKKPAIEVESYNRGNYE